MDHGKKKFSGSREVVKKAPPLGLVIVLAAVGGVVLGSAVTYSLTKAPLASKQSASPAAGGTPQAQPLTMPTLPPQQQFTPAAQPPGAVPPGKVWSAEHGHWHDAPVAVTIPASAPPSAPAPATPAPTAVPAEKPK